MGPIGKLGIGPMSPETVEAVFRYSDKNPAPLMLIASKNQVDYSGGYVSGWTTSAYAKFTGKLKKQHPKAKVYLCRDHCGPGFNGRQDLKDVYATINSDIENNFDLIHIDFCHYQGSEKTKLLESQKAIEYIQKKSPKMLIEIGTDENTGRDFGDLGRIEKNMDFFASFCKPQFFVCQTGSLIKEINQRGQFQKSYVEKLKRLADKYGFYLKEHNADYLSLKEIRQRRGLVGAVNVAPQFGVIQTFAIINKALEYGVDITDFLEVSYRSGKWQKWLDQNTPENKFLCAVTAGHYNFTSDAYKKIIERINKHENIKETIIGEIVKVIDLYIKNL